MSHYTSGLRLIVALSLVVGCVRIARAQEQGAAKNVQVHVVITDAALQEDKDLPPLQKEDVKVKQGKKFLPVTQVIPAKGDSAALQLMILIDDTLNTSRQQSQ